MSDLRFDLDSASRRKLGYKLIDIIDRYFASLPDRPVQLPLDERTFGPLADKMPDVGADAEAVLEELCCELIDKGFHVPAANYFGLMNPTPTYLAVLAEALVAATNPQLATLARSQLASKIEIECVRWIGERIYGASAAADGTFTSGGNEANFSALAMALAAHFPQSVEEGVAGLPAKPVLYASTESHHSLDKSAGLLGLGRKALRRIPANDRAQMDIVALVRHILEDRQQELAPFCVVATAGTTNSGAVDDLEALAGICREHKLWLHVDGAYGAAATFSDEHRGLMRGMERADSVTIDPHKWLAMPFAAGVVLTSRPETLSQTFAVSTPYMPRAHQAPLIDNFKISTQWSRRMNSLKLYLTLRVHGRAAYEELIGRQLNLAREFARKISLSPHFELVMEPQLTIVNVRVRGRASEAETAAAHSAIVEAVTRDGKRWISQTLVNGRSVIRIMVISYLTEERHLQELLQAMESAAEHMR